ncbi:MAG TPA: radical SAM protein [Actinospica sp.]|nr:radical SAM protein [Actinospica sp.]
MSTQTLATTQAPGATRLLRGERNWWFLGPGGTARLREEHLTADRRLLPGTERRLHELGVFETAPISTYSLTVLTSTHCNLGCGYCFQNSAQDPSGGSRPPRIARTRLTSPTITSILDFTRRRMDEAGLEKLTVLLFGGEPLLNPRGCLEVLERARGIGMTSAWMISNATLLTGALARQLAELGLGSVQVTFDGDREDHDRIRIGRADGGGTFDTIVRNIVAACESSPLRWTLRVNVSQETFAGIDALVERLAEQLDPSRCTLYFARVGDVGIGYANDLLHNGEMAAGFIRWQRRALDLGFSLNRPGARQLCHTCGYTDGRFGAVASADGTLSSCWETAGRPEWQVGSIEGGYLPAEQTEGRWVGCEDLYQYGEGAEALARFQDTVDVAVLDYLDEKGRR